VDCNSFFCSCERVFRPDLHNKPVIVLSNNDGCAVARSNEAKAVGISMGAPYFKIKNLCKQHNVHVFSSNYALYGDMSRRVMRSLSDLAPEIEIYSIDEAFISLTGFSEDNAFDHAKKIQEQILQHTGIPVSVGLGPSKVLAKAANHLAKKNNTPAKGVFSLMNTSLREKELQSFAVNDIWGIGRKSSEKLKSHNIHTADALRKSSESFIQKLLGINGKRILYELNGISCLNLETLDEAQKQIISSRSFGRPVFSLCELEESIAYHIHIAAEKLRQQELIAKSLIVFIHTSPHKNTPQYYNSAHGKLDSGTSATNKLIQTSFRLLKQIYKPTYEYKKAGVMLTDLTPKKFSQYNLFDTHDSPKDERLMQVFDLINQKEGPGSIKFAASGTKQLWKMSSKMKSPNYTTRWSELLSIPA